MPDGAVLERLANFGRELIESQDVDPVYPVLRHLYDARRMTPNQRHWFSALYLAYYSLPCALAVYRRWAEPQWHPEMVSYPRSAQRRQLRPAADIERHITDLATKAFKTGTGWGFVAWYDSRPGARSSC